MKTRHTKGPWEMLHEKDGDIWVFGNPKGRAAICRFLPPKNKYIHGETLETIDLTEENIANALLIAAAPDLYFGCRAALLTLEEDENYHKYTDIINTLKQAIQKAGAE